ncbi:MAG: hypothetical protein GX096_07860 [Clostridiales bacterium]|nr:hypothetical protein [Clostridiales bacterium]
MGTPTFSKPVRVIAEPIAQLYAKEYEDPRDAACLKALKLNKAFDQVVKYAIEYSIERVRTIGYTGSNVRVTRRNMPYLYECVETACGILSLPVMPDIYIVENPYINAFTTGSGHPIKLLPMTVRTKRASNSLLLKARKASRPYRLK